MINGVFPMKNRIKREFVLLVLYNRYRYNLIFPQIKRACGQWHCYLELGYVYVGATISDKSGDKSELPWFSNGNSLL
jgi:hypothetical protein